MESTRQKKFARQVQREMSEILQREVQGLPKVLITVSFVKVTADLQIARLYITCFPEEQTKPILTFLDEEKKKLRHILATRLKNVVKVVPELEFYEDDTLQIANKIDKLFEQIHEDEKQLAVSDNDETLES